MKPAAPAMIDEALLATLPPDTRGRVRSLRLTDGAAALVLDVAGLGASERARIEADSAATLGAQPGVTEARVALVAERTPARAPESAPAQGAARRILAVGSGKGGVGKSTLAANLAVALARAGRRVGLVDADIYGPSQPRLLGSEGQRPEARDSRMIPIMGRWGVPMLSMGHLIEPDRAIAWRGPMVGNALSQLLDAHWEESDLLVVDLPPGTGDVQLTMLQKFKPAGAVIVSTPQDLALIDARRAIDLFRQTGVPIAGIVENMAGYACPHCGEVSDPFGSGGAEHAAAEIGVPFLGRIPLTLAIRRDSDAGLPPAAADAPEGQAFTAIATRIDSWLDETSAA